MRISKKMSYSMEPKERRHVKGYGFLSFARKIGTHAAKVAKKMSNKYTDAINRCYKDCFKKSN